MILEQIISGIKSYRDAMNGEMPGRIVISQKTYDLLKGEIKSYMTIDDEAEARLMGIPIIIAEKSPKYAVLASNAALMEEVKQDD